MYSWKTIRTFCVLLLILPLIHLIVLISQETIANLDGSPEVWQDQVDRYAEADRTMSLPESPVVVIGGRHISLWRDLESITAPKPLLARPLGDATVDDLIYHYDRLVGFYRPGAVVLLPGNGEFQVRDRKSAKVLFQRIKALVTLDAEHNSSRRFYVIPPLKTPLYPSDYDKIDRLGRLLSAWATKQDTLTVLDANALLADQDGIPLPAHFRSDGVHLNESGYLRLGLLLREQLMGDFPQEYAATGAE